MSTAKTHRRILREALGGTLKKKKRHEIYDPSLGMRRPGRMGEKLVEPKKEKRKKNPHGGFQHEGEQMKEKALLCPRIAGDGEARGGKEGEVGKKKE